MAEHFISRKDADSDLLSAAAYLAENIKSADGHAEAMKAIVPLYLAAGNVDLAAELANEVGEPFSQDKLLTLIAEKCAEIDDDEYALQLAEAIEDQGLQAQAFERIALVKAASGQTEKAREIADTMVHPDFVLGGIAVDQAAKGDDAAAMQTIESIDFPTAKVSALQHMAAAKIERSDSAKAADLLDLGVEAANGIEHDEEKIRSLCDIGHLFIDAKRSDKAVETFDAARTLAEVLDNVHRDFFLVSCGLGFLYAGSQDLADRTLDLVTDKTQMASALLGFARDYWKKDQKDDAIEALDEGYEIVRSQRDTETRDSRARFALLANIAVQFAGFGKSDKSLEIAQDIPDPDEQVNALSQIAQVFTIRKEDEMARQTLNMIADEPSRLAALIAVADVKEKDGEGEAAAEFLNEAVTFSETVPQLAARSGSLNELAVRFAGHGQMGKARELSVENLNVIAEIRDESSQAAALAALSTVYSETGLEIGEAESAIVRGLIRKVQ